MSLLDKVPGELKLYIGGCVPARPFMVSRDPLMLMALPEYTP